MRKKIIALSIVMLLGQAAWAEPVQDPYEGYNRFMFKVNDSVDRHVMTPVARGYRKITPSPVRTGVRNFFNNLRDVVSLGSNILRLNVEKAATDFFRIGINSTFGLGGLIDIADAGQVPNNKNTLGDTFASWGWKNSHYFVFPLMGPSTVRDSLGNAALYAYPVSNAVFSETGARWGAAGLNALQTRESLLDVTDSLDDAALDRYAYVRDMYMNMRNREVGATTAANSEDDNIDIDSLVSAEGDGDTTNNIDNTANNTVSGNHDSQNTSHDAATTDDISGSSTEQHVAVTTEPTTPDNTEATSAEPEQQPYWHVKHTKHHHAKAAHLKKHHKHHVLNNKKHHCHR